MFTRIRTINGRQYLYQEERYRENGKVRSKSKSLGPVGGYVGPLLYDTPEERKKRRDAERAMDRALRAAERSGEEADRWRAEKAAKDAAAKAAECAKEERAAEAAPTHSSSPETAQPDAPGSNAAEGEPPSDQ